MRRIVVGVTAHGLGHLTRTAELVNGLSEVSGGLEFHFWTALDRATVARSVMPPFTHRPVGYEPGTAQKTCFELDLARTVSTYVGFLESCWTRVAEEEEQLRALGCDAVICDSPGILARAASRLGLPVVAVCNFTWDWILEPILEGTEAEPAVAWLRDAYGSGAHHIRLPFGPEASSCVSSEPGPLISRRARLAPHDVWRTLGLERVADGRKIVLVCPGGWQADDWERVEPDTADFTLVTVGDLPVALRAGDVSLPHDLLPGVSFPDLVEAADVVLAKPGYGIASECVAHRTPIVTVDRPAFRETPLLRRELSRIGPCAEMSLDDFFTGRWSDSLRRALACVTAWEKQAEHPRLELAGMVLEALR